jgi:hypothetical protein
MLARCVRWLAAFSFGMWSNYNIDYGQEDLVFLRMEKKFDLKKRHIFQIWILTLEVHLTLT